MAYRDDAALFSEVAGWLAAGYPVPEIERRLVDHGVTPQRASRVVDEVMARQVARTARLQRARDRLKLFLGVACCLLGALLLAASIAGFQGRVEWLTRSPWGFFVTSLASFGLGVRWISAAVV